MNGTLPDSLLEYDSSLIDGCLMHFTDCNGTIAFWAQFPNNDVTFLSTAKTPGVNSGIIFSVFLSNVEVNLVTGSTLHYLGSSMEFVPFEWYHIAFAYEHKLGVISVALYINSVESLTFYGFQKDGSYLSEAFMASGLSSLGVTGFGIIDELFVFPEYLTESQIKQLMEISN